MQVLDRTVALSDNGTIVDEGKTLLILTGVTTPRGEDHAKDSRCNRVTMRQSAQRFNGNGRNTTNDAMPRGFPSTQKDLAKAPVNPMGLHCNVGDTMVDSIKSLSQVKFGNTGFWGGQKGSDGVKRRHASATG